MSTDPTPRRNALFLLPSLMRGGAETQLVHLINNLSPRRLNKQLVTFEKPLDQATRLDRESVGFQNILREKKLDLRLARRLARAIDQTQADVVHCTLVIAIFYGWLARRRSQRQPPLLAAVHKSYNQSRKTDLIDRVMASLILRDFDRVIFVCENQRQIWTERYPWLAGRSAVVYNGVDTEHFDPQGVYGECVRKRLGIDNQARVIACIARFAPVKGHAHLIASFAAIPGEPVLLLAGDGELRPDIEADVARRGLADRVHFLGAQSDVRPVLHAADVVVLPSVSETFSMAMLEAFAMGVPVVGSDVGGMSEAVIPGRTGALAPVGDSTALAAALAALIEDRDALVRMGTECRRMVVERFSLMTMVKTTEDLIADVADRYAAPTAATTS